MIQEQLQVQRDLFAAQEHLRTIPAGASPLHAIRQCFDQLPRSSEADWEALSAQLVLVPRALQSYELALRTLGSW